MNETNSRLIVAAIDFGTTYSGWAFSSRHEFQQSPTKIQAKLWSSKSYVSMKAPTTVLIKPDGQTLDAFGYEAEDRYSQLAADEKHSKYYYFKLFKMMLFGKSTITRDMLLEDDKDQTLPAIRVFSLAIKFLHDDLLNNLAGSKEYRDGDSGIKKDSIHWVLTVPAIWDNAAKQFMIEAAEAAGISPMNLRIALEPEAASLYCRHLPVKNFVTSTGQKKLGTFEVGSTYMVLDAGGGTVDITVHEVVADGKLKELHRASGGDWGGTKVDNAFKQMLVKLFSLPILRKFQKENTDDYIDLFREFEIKKRTISPKKTVTDLNVRIPLALKTIFEEETGEDLAEVIKQTEYKDTMSFSSDKLKVNISVFKGFFDESITGIIRHLKALFSDECSGDPSSILMVGGFSESSMLQAAIKTEFPNKTLIIPEEAGLAVLKGAVIYGHHPAGIEARVSRYSLGIELHPPFKDGVHDVSRRFESNGRYYCKEVFDKHVEVGQTLKTGEPQSERTYAPVSSTQDHLKVTVHASTQKNPKYVTDPGCFKFAEAIIRVRDMSVPLHLRTICVTMTFSGTAIEVAAKEKQTGNITVAKLSLFEI